MEKNKKLVIFGLGETATLAYHYFKDDSPYKVVGFCVDSEFFKEEIYQDLPVVKFEEITIKFPPKEYSLFVALPSLKLNTVRAKKYTECKQLGYEMASYISSKAYIGHHTTIGENCFILEDNTIQPFVTIGNDVFMWSGNHIGHRDIVKDHCFITSHVVISGFTVIGENSYIGVNSSITEGITIGDFCLIGLGSIIHKDTPPYSIYKQEYAKKQMITTKQFYNI